MSDYAFHEIKSMKDTPTVLLINGEDNAPDDYLETLRTLFNEEYPVSPDEVTDESMVELACISAYDLHMVALEENGYDSEDAPFDFAATTVIKLGVSKMIVICDITPLDDEEEDEASDSDEDWS